MQEIDMTDAEKKEMYMKLKKDEIVMMLIQANNMLKAYAKPTVVITKTSIGDFGLQGHNDFERDPHESKDGYQGNG